MRILDSLCRWILARGMRPDNGTLGASDIAMAKVGEQLEALQENMRLAGEKLLAPPALRLDRAIAMINVMEDCRAGEILATLDLARKLIQHRQSEVVVPTLTFVESTER